MKYLKYLLFMAFFSLLGVESQAQLVSVRIGIPAPPPPRRVTYRPHCPGPDYVWHDGRWVWDSYRREYYWEEGFWEYIEPRYYSRDEHYHEPRGHAHGHYKNKKRRCD